MLHRLKRKLQLIRAYPIQQITIALAGEECAEVNLLRWNRNAIFSGAQFLRINAISNVQLDAGVAGHRMDGLEDGLVLVVRKKTSVRSL